MKTATDKRSEERRPVSHSVRFEFTTTDSGQIGNVSGEGSGVDQSPRGMGILTKLPLQRGQVLRLFLPVTEGQTSVSVFTEVMWSIFTEGYFRIGLRYLNMPPCPAGALA